MSFTLKQHLENHTKTHIGEMPFHCDICDKVFEKYKDLQTHKTTHTVTKPTFSDKLPHNIVHDNKDLYKCRLCNSTFTSKESHENHLNTHIGEITFLM